MFQFTVLTGLAALLCAGLGHVDARALVQRDVVSPPITYPTTGTQWSVGDRHNVTWDTSIIPAGFTSTGMIVLGFLDDSDGGQNEHLDLDNPLAKGFPITDGRAEITVPSVTTRNTYILILFGDSGNASGKFTIKNISIGGTGSSSSPAATSSAATVSASASPTPTSTDDKGGSSGGGDKATSSGATTIASGTGTGSDKGSDTDSLAKPTGTVAVTAASGSITGSATSQGTAVGQSASPSTTPANAGARTASFSGPMAWVSMLCSLAVILGSAL